jgi:hypothetical protein
MANPYNQVSRDINNGLYKKRKNQPSVTTIVKWKNEWVEKGLDKKMSFLQFKSGKLKVWRRNKKFRK